MASSTGLPREAVRDNSDNNNNDGNNSKNKGTVRKTQPKLVPAAAGRQNTVLKMRRWDRFRIRGDDDRRLSVALVGRPNVGKSTLFNRLTREKDAIIHDVPGTTRDWRMGQGSLGDLEFNVIDTGGLEEGSPTSMPGQIVAQCERAIEESQLVLFLLDAQVGVIEMDLQFAKWIRKLSGQTDFEVQVVVNKTEVS